MRRIHPSATIDLYAELGEDIEIGAYAVVGGGVHLGDRSIVMPHAVLMGPSQFGAECIFHPFSVIGGLPQHKRHADAPTRLIAGPKNVFREHVTVHRGTHNTMTRIGEQNLFMVGCHVAHDVQIGSHCVVANAVQLAGHVTVGDHVIFGGAAGVAQFVHVGESAFVAAGAMVERSVLPFTIVQGDRARLRGVNRIGLERRGVAPQTIRELQRIVFAIMKSRARAVTIKDLRSDDPLAQKLLLALAAE